MEYDHSAAAGSRQTYLHGNLIGTTEATTSASAGSPPSAGRAVYTAFGERVYANGVGGGRYGYAGAWGYQAAGTEQCGPVGETYSCDPLEELGWLHVGERYYDPACGRFVQRDPIGIAGGFNVYVYVENMPTIGIDPTGLLSIAGFEFNQEWLDNLGGDLGRGVGAAGDGLIPFFDPFVGWLYCVGDPGTGAAKQGGEIAQDALLGAAGLGVAANLSRFKAFRWVNNNRWVRIGPSRTRDGMWHRRIAIRGVNGHIPLTRSVPIVKGKGVPF